MVFNIGPIGIGMLVAISVLFGVAAQFVFLKGTRWMWLIAGGAWFIGGLVASEIIWGGLTIDDIQPIIDGLALDESLLGGLLAGIPTALIVHYVSRGMSVAPTQRPI